MSPQTTSEIDVDDLSLREKLEYAVEQTAAKIGLQKNPDRPLKQRGRLRDRISRVFPQWLRTALVAVIEMGAAMTWLAAAATYSQMAGAITIAALHPVAVAIATHVWPTRTPPWRTLVWTWLMSWLTASVLYIGWGVSWALYAAIAVIVVITVARCNANARRLWNFLVRKNIERQFGKGTTLNPTPEPLPSASERHAKTVRRREAAAQRRTAMLASTARK